MFDTFKNRLEITGILWTVTALRISAGRSTEPIGSDLPVIKDALGRPFIPGSSLKGALRSRLESFLRGIAPNLAEDPSELSSKGRISQVNTLKETANNDKNATEQILEQTDLVSRLFGAPWLASKFQIRDLTVLPDYWFGQYQERDGVAIDRDTETAADGKLYDYQVVPADTPFQFHAVVENAEEWELGLLMLGLHQLETEQIPLGGGRSRGLGVVRLEIDKMQWIHPENPQEIVGYLQNLVDDKLSSYQLNAEKQTSYKKQWTTAFINELNKYLTKSSDSQAVSS